MHEPEEKAGLQDSDLAGTSVRKGWKAKTFHSIIFSLGFHSNSSLSRSKLSQWKQTLSCLWAVCAYVYFLPPPAQKPPRWSHGLGLVTSSRQMGLRHVFNNRLVGPSQEAENCQLKTQQQRAGPNIPHAMHPFCARCSLHALSTSCDKSDFLVKGTLRASSYKITMLEIFFQLLKGTLVSLLTCPGRRLAGLSLPLCGLLWEFPALLLLRRLFKGSMNNLALTKSGLKQVKTGPFTFTNSFQFLQAQGIKKIILNVDI